MFVSVNTSVSSSAGLEDDKLGTVPGKSVSSQSGVLTNVPSLLFFSPNKVVPEPLFSPLTSVSIVQYSWSDPDDV